MILPSLVDLEARAADRLANFARMAWPYAGTDGPLVDGWYVDAICDHLQALAEGQIKKLVINIPPRHGKSTFGCVCLPSWCWIKDTKRRMSFSSYSDKYAKRDSMYTRDLVTSEWYRERWVHGAWELEGDRNTQGDFSNTMGGQRVVLGKATGAGGTLVCADDPISADDARSEPIREETIRWWTQTMGFRVNSADTVFLVIQQRLHERDLSGYVLASELGYDHLMIPLEYDPKRSKVTSLGWKDPRKEEGELMPTRFTPKFLADRKKEMGSYAWAGQMNQNPSPAEGGMFQRKWWRFWKPDGLAAEGVPRPDKCWTGPAIPLPKSFDDVVISLDAAFKDKPTSDRVAFVVVGRKGARRYVLDVVCKNIDAVETAKELVRLAKKWPRATRKLIEAKANGDAVVSMLQGKISGMIEITPEGGKESRAAAMQPEIEAGDVFLPDGASWLDDFVDEHAKFPKGSHDDQVDAMSQCLNDMRQNDWSALWPED